MNSTKTETAALFKAFKGYIGLKWKLAEKVSLQKKFYKI
jgi:hypothetical protein